MKERLLFIYNPHAGKGRVGTKLNDIINVFAAAGYEVIAHPTNGQLDARNTAYEYATTGRCDRIVCAGGDGTFAEAAGGCLNSGTRIPIGFIPVGTTNDFAYSLGIPNNIKKAAELSVNGVVKASDIGTMNGRPFTYAAAFGLFTDVTYDTPQNVKNALGRMAYLLNGASKIYNIKSYKLLVEGDNFSVEDVFIHGMIVNSNSVGGFKGITGKHVELDDGLYEMIFISMPKNIIQLQEIINALLTGDLEKCQYIYYERVSRLKITSDAAIPWSLDGEYGGDLSEADVEIHKQKVQYILNEKTKPGVTVDETMKL